MKCNFMDIKIVEDKISKSELEKLAKEGFGYLIKAVVDLEKGIMAVGGEMHADEEAQFIEMGSKQENLWGINLRFDKGGEDWIEFDSMINVRPSHGNSSRSIESQEIRDKIKKVVGELVINS